MNSIFVRIYLATIVFFFLVLLLFTEFLYHIDSKSDDYFTQEAKELVTFITSRFSPKNQAQWDEVIKEFNNNQLYTEVRLISASELDSDINLVELNTLGNMPMDTEEEFRQVFWLKEADRYLLISTSGLEEIPFSIVDEYGYYILLCLALSFGYFMLIYLITKPIKKLTKAVNLFSTGDTNVRVNENHPKPIDQLAKQFNRMADSISQQLEQQRIMIGAIPHELRTPLSHIRFALDMTNTSSEMSYIRGLIEQIDSSTDEMEQAIDDTVDFLKIQGIDTLPSNLCNLNKMVVRALISIDFGLVKIHNDVDKSLEIKLNEPLITLAMKNVLSNAIRHTLSQIQILSIPSHDKIQIIVNDDGPGIPEKARKKIFSPFAKVCESRQKIDSGIGMGLSMVAMIVHKHNGTIEASTNDWGGASIILTLPNLKPSLSH